MVDLWLILCVIASWSVTIAQPLMISQPWQSSAPKGILPHPPSISAWDSFDTSSSHPREKYCQWPHAFESDGGRPWNIPETPSLRIGGWSALL